MLKTLPRRNWAIVTGGTGGVGREIANIFNNNNIPVIITSRNQKNATNVANSLYNNHDTTTTPIVGAGVDLNNNDSVEHFINEIKFRNYKIKYLINNAGVLNLEKINTITKKKLDLLFNVNVLGPLCLSGAFLNDIKQNKGAILFNSPPYKIDEKTTRIMPYMQSKLAQTTLMKSLSNSLPPSTALISSFWTDYPLATDAILKRGVGEINDCLDPLILAETVEEMIWGVQPQDIHGKEIVDDTFLKERGISIDRYILDPRRRTGGSLPPPQKLDKLFMSFLRKNS